MIEIKGNYYVVHSTKNRRQSRFAFTQFFFRLLAFRDVLYRTFVREREPFLITNEASGFRNPNLFSGFVSVDFGFEVGHYSLFIENAFKFLTSMRINIPFGSKIVDCGKHLLFGTIAVEFDESRVCAQLTAINTHAIDAFNRILKDRAIVPLRSS